MRPKQNRNLSFRKGLSAAAARLAMFVVLVLAATYPAESQTFTVLHTFTGGTDGGVPLAGLTMDRAGHLYGLAADGGYYGGDCGIGDYGCGTAFKLSRSGSGWVFSVLYTFQGGYDGAVPGAEILGSDGSLYGTTDQGGIGHCDTELGTCGTFFKLSPPTTACKSALCPWTETVLYRFTGLSDGGTPIGDLASDSDGNLYGTAESGGQGAGAVFEMTPSSGGWTEQVLYAFAPQNDGAGPNRGVIFDQAGNIYGTTIEGGKSYLGTIFQLTYLQYSWNESLLYQFNNGTSGENPDGRLLIDDAGNLYGTTSYGGVGGCGTVFELTPAGGGWNFSILYNISGGSGSCGPTAGLIMDAAGNLYGTTSRTGAYGHGAVFKLTLIDGAWTYTSLHDFTGGNDGSWPGELIMDANGNLYGTAYFGAGQQCHGSGCGVVFEITP